METIKTSQTKIDKFIAEAEFNRFGVISIVLTVVGILGGVTTGLGAVGNTFLLSLVIIPTMITLSFLLAVAPIRWILAAGSVSVAIDLIISAYFIFVK